MLQITTDKKFTTDEKKSTIAIILFALLITFFAYCNNPENKPTVTPQYKNVTSER